MEVQKTKLVEQQVAVLDFTTATVHIFNLPEGVDDIESFLDERGFDVSNCQWMAG